MARRNHGGLWFRDRMLLLLLHPGLSRHCLRQHADEQRKNIYSLKQHEQRLYFHL